MKNRKYIVLMLLIVNIYIVSCSMPKINNSKSTSFSETNMLEIRGLSLKYIIIETASDMYLANVEKPDYFSVETFKKLIVLHMNISSGFIRPMINLMIIQKIL